MSSQIEESATAPSAPAAPNQTDNMINSQSVSKAAQPHVVYVQEPRQVSMATGLILFIVGFFCFPCWWVGACCLPKTSLRSKEDFTWLKANRIMTGISIVVVIVVIVLVSILVVAVNAAAN